MILALAFVVAAQVEPNPVPVEPRVEEPRPIEPRVEEGPAPREDVGQTEEVKPADKPVSVVGDVEVGARFGVSAGNILVAPFVIPGPGGFLNVKGRTVAFHLVEAGLDAGVAVGVANPGDATPVAGYKARGLVGLRFDALDVLVWRVDAHAGISSVALFPVPRFGLGAELGMHVPIGAGFTADAKTRIDADLVVIAPAPAASLEAGLRWQYGALSVGAHLGADVDALIVIVANTVSGSGFASLDLTVEL